MIEVQFSNLKENVKVGDVMIVNTCSDPKLYMCKKNGWHVVSVEPQLVFRKYGQRNLMSYTPNHETTLTILNKKEFKALPLNAMRKFYTTEQIDEAKEIIRDKVLEVFRNLPWKQANLISYILRPNSTAFGAAWSYNEDNIDNIIYQNIIKRDNLEYDGTSGHTLIEIAKHIKDGWFDK